MSDTFMWTPELTKKMFKLRFQNDDLFKQKRQPWHAFYDILLANGFPKEMNLDHVRKKWGYTYDCYKLAKKTKNKNWKYYKLFEKHFIKPNVTLDKYEPWSDEWRQKLVECILEAKELKLDGQDLWKMVEKNLRNQDLPSDCCIQDIKTLWSHLKTIFHRKHRIKFRTSRSRRKRGKELISKLEWPLYDIMLSYYNKYEKQLLGWIETEGALIKKTTGNSMPQKKNLSREEGRRRVEFQWTRDITESFIQIRLQHDWMFKDSKWAWTHFMSIMIEQYGFPRTLNGRELCRKWSSTYAEYQKAKATNNTNWIYFNLFECYLGDGSFSLNPLLGWQDEWVIRFIEARTDLEHLFHEYKEQLRLGWREVEKRLRSGGIPVDHSLLELQDMWTFLLKTYRWKRKFADKGVLNEQWPFFEAMCQYKLVEKVDIKPNIKRNAHFHDNNDAGISFQDDDEDDDIKLFDLKQRMRLKQEVNLCRACGDEEGAYNIYEACDDHGLSLAEKLRTVVGLQISKTDNLPAQICFTCLRDLETSFAFKQKCIEADKKHRSNNVKLEIILPKLDETNTKPADFTETIEVEYDDDMLDNNDNEFYSESEPPKEARGLKKSKKKEGKRKHYVYLKICEICGKHTQNLVAHLDTHAKDKMYSCHLCDKRFKFKSGLMIHKAIHDPTPKKTCEVCGKTFHILAQYRRHFVYHANERKHACDTCGKRFNTIDILKVHQRMHTDERPFSCPDCGKTFRTAGCVSRHRRIVHKKTSRIEHHHTGLMHNTSMITQ